MTARIVGFILLGVGITFLGQNVIFSSHFSFFPFRWQTIVGAGSVLAILSGVVGLVFGGNQFRTSAISSLIAGTLFGFFSGVITVLPTSLAEVFIGICLMVLGARLMIDGNMNVF